MSGVIPQFPHAPSQCTQGQFYLLLTTVLSLITLQFCFLSFIPWGREAATAQSVSNGPGFNKKNIFWKVHGYENTKAPMDWKKCVIHNVDLNTQTPI